MPEEAATGGSTAIQRTIRCMRTPATLLTDDEIKKCMNTLLYDVRARKLLGAKERESLNIVIKREKADNFNFLEGFTRWGAVGSWRELDKEGKVVKEFPEEENYYIEIEFKDTKDRKIGKKLLELLTEFNKRVVKEDLLYVTIKPIIEGTLFIPGEQPKFRLLSEFL
jgi:hypothetical protein